MTDHKSWLWRKKPLEKTVVVAQKVDLDSGGNEDEIHVLLAEKAELERDLRDLGDKLSSALAECSAKEDLLKKHAKTAKEALAGWEKAEAKALSLKQELDEALDQRETSEERTSHLDAALKECMQQLRFVREDQEHRIHDVLLKASEEIEETKMFLGEKLEEASKMITKLTAENSQLGKVLLLKEQLIEDLNQEKAKAEADMSALLSRLEMLEKDNKSLSYEVRLLEKEVDIRNEEREFNRRTADATHKQHLENVKKIAKLESECQRLRVLVRKRLPGPAAVAKMRSEVDLLQRDSDDNRRKKSNSSISSNLQLDSAVDGYPESPGRKTSLLTEKICALEEENHSLREALQKKMNELQFSRNMYAQTALKLSQFEAQLEESPKGQLTRDIRSSTMLYDLSLASMSDIGSDDKVSCAGSWASKSVGVSDINHLMDDFVEMEKLALVCVDKPTETSSITKKESNLNSLALITGKELVPIASYADANVAGVNINKPLPFKLSKSISKLIEIIEGINLPSENSDVLQTPRERHENNYVVRVFQWRTSEIAATLEKFLRTCDDLLNGKADFEMFTQEMTSVLEWIVNHCFSLQDVSSMKDTIKKRFDWDETKSESETEAGMFGHFSVANKLSLLKNGYHSESHCHMSEESRKLKDVERTMDASKLEFECESLRNQLQNSESIIAHLQAELEALKHSKDMTEDQLENYKMTIEDLNSQLLSVKSEMDEANQKFSSLEAELKNKVNHCEEMEAKCLDLQVQLERVTKMDIAEDANQDGKQLRTEREISAASEKLAECQETILHLGKQLRALASSRDTVVSDKFISTPTDNNTANSTALMNEKKLTSQRSSLLDRMQAEDNAEVDQLESPKTKEIICAQDFGSHREIAVGSLAIVPSKKQQTTSGGLFRKLLWRKKKGSSKKMSLPFAP